MKIYIYYQGHKVTGRIRAHTKYFLEMEITSPYSGYITSRSVPCSSKDNTEFIGKVLSNRCRDLLVELFELGRSIEQT